MDDPTTLQIAVEKSKNDFAGEPASASSMQPSRDSIHVGDEFESHREVAKKNGKVWQTIIVLFCGSLALNGCSLSVFGRHCTSCGYSGMFRKWVSEFSISAGVQFSLRKKPMISTAQRSRHDGPTWHTFLTLS